MPQKTLIFDNAQMDAAIVRIADEIIAEFQLGTPEALPIALVGIQKQGVPFAHRLCNAIEAKTACRPFEGILDINMYRDDFGVQKLPVIRETVIPFAVDDCNVVLCDDVLASGRTIRAALDALTDYGRPRVIRLAIMLDRVRYEYPIRADYSGFNYKAPVNRKILVNFKETDGSDGIYEKPWAKVGVFKA